MFLYSDHISAYVSRVLPSIKGVSMKSFCSRTNVKPSVHTLAIMLFNQLTYSCQGSFSITPENRKPLVLWCFYESVERDNGLTIDTSIELQMTNTNYVKLTCRFGKNLHDDGGAWSERFDSQDLWYVIRKNQRGLFMLIVFLLLLFHNVVTLE